MVKGEGSQVACVCISYTVDVGQVESSCLRSGRVCQGGEGNIRKVSGQTMNEVVDKWDV